MLEGSSLSKRKKSKDKFEEYEELYSGLFDTIPVGIGIVDVKGNLIEFNKAMLKPGGYTRKDIEKIGDVASLYFDSKERAKILKIVKKQGFINEEEVRFKRKDGTPYTALLSLRPIKFKGNPCMVATVEDITERKREEGALRESEEKFRSLSEKSLVGVYLIQDEIFKPRYLATLSRNW
jgi:PAS domain S-box-containing protein